MNRYRTVPALSQPKASGTTTCQKCLKKDDYECKSTTQERPYISRPSRTQQLLNPKLKPKLAADEGNSLMKTQGVADAELARVQAARDAATNKERSRSPEPDRPKTQRQRSVSVSSDDSVSTISTSRSKTPPPKERTDLDKTRRGRGRQSRSRSTSRPRKRKLRDSSVSHSPPPRIHSTNKNRRYRSSTPEDRGRPTDDRRGSRRSRSRDVSSNRSEITKQRRSLDEVHESNGRGLEDVQLEGRTRNRGGYRHAQQPTRKERSLSPYSRRLALTQAMNMGR